jgi:hypothetical protein
MHASTIHRPEPEGGGLDQPIDLPRFYELRLPASYIFLGTELGSGESAR